MIINWVKRVFISADLGQGWEGRVTNDGPDGQWVWTLANYTSVWTGVRATEEEALSAIDAELAIRRQ